MPAFEHAVAGPLAGDDLAVELARQPDREIADIDHLLHLALALFDDLAGLDRDEPAQRRLVAAQFLGEEPHQFAAAGWRYRAPQEKGAFGGGDHKVEIAGAVAA